MPHPTIPSRTSGPMSVPVEIYRDELNQELKLMWLVLNSCIDIFEEEGASIIRSLSNSGKTCLLCGFDTLGAGLYYLRKRIKVLIEHTDTEKP